VPFAVRARLGSLETGAHEQFVPLVAQEILSASSTPAGDGLNKPLLEWEEVVLDTALNATERRKKERESQKKA
jgi:hypothetical protein